MIAWNRAMEEMTGVMPAGGDERFHRQARSTKKAGQDSGQMAGIVP
jgi:hypothetical protein